MEIYDNTELNHYKKDCSPILEDLFSLMLNMFSGNLLISCITDNDTIQCQIRCSSKTPNAILMYHNNTSDVRTHCKATSDTYLQSLYLHRSTNGKSEINECSMFSYKIFEKNGDAYLMNDILNDMFCIILDIISGTKLCISRTYLNWQEYNMLSCVNRPSLFLMQLDRVTDEKVKDHMKCWESYEVSLAVEDQYNFPESLSGSRHLQLQNSLYTGGRPYQCKYYWKFCHYSSGLKAHERIHSGESSFNGRNCGKSFSFSGEAKRHELLHTKQTFYECKFCGKTFSRTADVKRHERLHTGERPYTCKYCGKSFSRAESLKSHERRIQMEEGHYKCRYCENSFSFSCEHKSHERLHIEARSYSCKYCEKKFLTLHNLISHERWVHTGERPYKCSYCEKTFPFFGDVRRHERLHTGEKPYTSKYCGKKFSRAQNLKAHERSYHMEESLYKCTYSEKCFPLFCDVKSPETLYTNKKLYKCKFCERAFPFRKEVKSHERVVHIGGSLYE